MKTRLYIRRTLALATLTTLLPGLGSCVDDDRDPATQHQRPTAPMTQPLKPQAPPAPPSDKLLSAVFTDGEGRPALPKWLTEHELNLQRLAAIRAANGSTSLIDKYSDYRDKNIDKFYVTKPPATAGIRVPSEYEPQQAYLLNWRSNYTSLEWRKLFMEIIKGAWGVVPVLLIHKDAAHKAYIEKEMTANGFPAAEIASAKYILWWKNDSDAIWARDFGPVSIVGTSGASKGVLSFVDFRYYHTRILDDEVPTDLAKEWGVNVFRPDMDFEGGNFMSTTDGLCAATRGVLWYNLQLSQSAVEKIFSDYLGCKKSFFPSPMAGGVIAHIDMFSKYSSDTTVLVGRYTAKQHADNAKILNANAALFAKTKNGSGKAVKVIRIPMPDVGTMLLVYKIWRTYTNSLSVTADGKTGVVLIPTYDDETKNEKAAMAAYAKAYPGWKLVKIDSKIIIPGQGAIHCITMQIPAGTRSKMETAPVALCDKTKYECVTGACGKVTAQGCCDGHIRKYCDKGKLKASDCASKPICGWDSSKKYYACGTKGGGDPSGKYPRSCNVVTGAADASVWDGTVDQSKPDLVPVVDGPPVDQELPDQSKPDQALPDLPLPDRALPDHPLPDQPLPDLQPDAGDDGDGEDGGCSYSTSEPHRGSLGMLVLLGVMALVARRRRGS